MQIEDHARLAASTGGCPVAGIGREFNPFVDPYLSDPYLFWLRARQSEPVFYSPELDYWVVTRYEDIKAIFSDVKTFSASIASPPSSPAPGCRTPARIAGRATRRGKGRPGKDRQTD